MKQAYLDADCAQYFTMNQNHCGPAPAAVYTHHLISQSANVLTEKGNEANTVWVTSWR